MKERVTLSVLFVLFFINNFRDNHIRVIETISIYRIPLESEEREICPCQQLEQIKDVPPPDCTLHPILNVVQVHKDVLDNFTS